MTGGCRGTLIGVGVLQRARRCAEVHEPEALTLLDVLRTELVHLRDPTRRMPRTGEEPSGKRGSAAPRQPQGWSWPLRVNFTIPLPALARLVAALPHTPQASQVIANGRRIGDGGERSTTPASCAFRASISAASSIDGNSSARLATMAEMV